MPDNKEKLITAENQGKGVTPTAGSKMLIRPAADPIKIAPAPPKLDKNGNPVIPPYDATGKSFNEIADYYNSVEASRIDPSAVQEAGYDPYKQYEALGDESAFYAGGDWAKQASDQQGFGQQAKNAIVGGTLNGVVKAVEALSFIPNILTRDWEKSAFQESLAQAQQDINQALPVYSDPNNPLSMDSSMFWGGVKGIIESGLQFAIPGKAISSGLGAAGKLLSTGARAALAAEGTAGTILESMATKVSTKAGALMEGMIAEPAKRAALVEWAKSVPAGLIQNQLEGTIMGMEVYDQKVAELRAAGETDEAYIRKEASAVADQMRNQNMLMIVKDMWEMKTIFGKPTKGAQILTDKSRYFPKPSEMMIWKKDVWKAAWNGSKNPFMLSMGEAGEEMFQGGLEDNIMNQSRIRENKDHEGNENFTKLAVDKDKADGGPLAVLGYAFTDQNIFEGMMGFFGGGFQNAIGNIPGKVADNKNYKRLNAQLTAINEQIEAEPIEENKEILRTQAAQIKAEIGNTLKGHYEAQQAQVSENQELLKNKFDNLLDAHEVYEKAVFENDTVTQELIKDNLFAKAAMDNLKKGTLANFRESIQEIADGTPQAANLVDGEVTPESRAKAKEMLERLTDIETSWNRHKDTQLGERKFFVGENKKIIKRGFENVNKKSESVKTRINDEIAEYNKAQKIINPDHVDLGSIDEISEGKINPIGLSEADQIVYRNLTDRKKKLSEDPLSMNSHDIRQLDKFIIREEELKTLDKTNKEKAAEFLNDPELQAVRDQTEMLDRAEKKNTEEETYLNSAQYRYWKDRINTFISKNAEKITSNKLEELADEIKGAVKDVNSKTRFDGVGKKDASSKKSINTAAKNDLLGQVRQLQFKLHTLEQLKNIETLNKASEELTKQKESLILGPFMNEAVRGNGYFKFKNKDGETNYAYINSASVDDDAIIQYTVNGRTEDELPYLSQVDDEGNVTKTGFKDAFMAGFVEASTEQEYVAKLMEMLKSMHTEVPVEEEFEEEEFEETEEDGTIGGFLPGSTSPMKAPVFEWDIEPIVNIETKPKPKNVSKKPKGNVAVDQEIEPVEDITIPPVEPTIIIEDEWEKNKLFTPSTTVSYLSRQYVKSTNGRVKNKNNTRTLKPIDTQEYLVGDPGYFRITDGNYDTHDVPIEIIIKGDEQNVNKAYVPTIASILATDGSIPGLFSEEDPTKSDAENKYMILNDRGLQVLAAIQAYVSDPNKANGNSYNKISTLIAAPFKNNKDKNPFTRMLTAKKEDKTVIRDFNMATDELINLYQNRSRVIADINAGIARPRTKIKSINSGRPARLVSNETETTPNTNLVRVSKFLKDTGVQVRQYESKKKGKFNVLSLPMKRSTLEDSVTMGVLVKVDKVDHDLVYAFIEDYLTKGPITRKLDSQAAMKLLNTVWGQEYENSDTKLPIADHIDLSEDKSTGERQIVFKHKNKKPTKNDFVKPDALIDNKLTESIKSAISAYIVDAKVNVLKINTNSKVDIETIKLNKGVLQKVVKSPLAMFADNSATDILATKAPNGEWIFHEQATFNLDYGLQMGDSIVDNSDFDAAMNAEADIKAIEESSEYKEGEAEWLREKHDAPLRLDPGAAINIIEDIARRRQEELNNKAYNIEATRTEYKLENGLTLQISTYADGSYKIFSLREGEIPNQIAEGKNSNELTQEYLEDIYGENFPKGTSKPIKTGQKDKINAKYDAELATLENTKPVSDKKADIERRREEELNNNEQRYSSELNKLKKQAEGEIKRTGVRQLVTGNRIDSYEGLIAGERFKINDKYDAELAALESKTTTSSGNAVQTPSDIETQKADIERRREEELTSTDYLSNKAQNLLSFFNSDEDIINFYSKTYPSITESDVFINKIKFFQKEFNISKEKSINLLSKIRDKIIEDAKNYIGTQYRGKIIFSIGKLGGDVARSGGIRDNTSGFNFFTESGENLGAIPNVLYNINKNSVENLIIDTINAKYDAELAALGRTTTQEANKEVQKADILQKKKERLANVKPMYHHTNVDTKDFNFNNFQRGNKQVSQFGDGLNASSNTTSFLVSRYGKPIQGEVNDADFVKINASKTEKEVYEELKKQGYIFSEIHDTNDVLSEVPGAAMELFTDFQKSNLNVKGVRVSNHIIGNTKVAPFYVIYDAKSFYGQGALSKKIEQESNAELAALNNLTNTDTPATEEKSKPVPDDDFSIATDDYESIIVDDDKNKALLDTYTIDYPGMTDSLKDDLVNDFAARIMTRFNGTAKSAPIKNIGDNLASVKKYYFEKYIPNQTNPILKDMPAYYNKLESLAFAKVQAMGLKITGKQVGNLAIDEMEALDFSGENGRAVERYDTSIFDIDDRDRASFRLKSKLALIRDGETQMGFDRYLDPENTYGLIRQLLANKPYMTVGEAVKFLREQKNQSRVLNLVADDIEKWDMSAKNEFRTVFNLHKNKTGIMLWNSKGGEYSANIIDADRVSGGRMMVSKWQSAFMDIVEDPNNNMVINSESEPYLINADKVNKIKEDYIELTNQYYEFEEVYGEVPNSAVYAEQIAGLLNQLGIDVVTDEIKSIIDYPYEYAKIAEGWERNNMSHVFNNKSGVIGVLFSNIGNIPSTKTELIGEDPETAINYVSMEKYNPFTEGGNYLSNLGKFISYKRGNIDSESAYSASGNIKFAYTIPNPLSNVVDRIKSGNYDIENASSFAQRSELVNDSLYDVELMDALKEETEGIFEESNKLKPAELESEELGGIQNNGNKRRFAQIPTNSDKSLFAKTSLSANRESNTFLEDQIANNSAYLVKSVEIESERMRQFNGLSTGIADSKTIDGLTGNTKYDNGYKYFYLLPTANIQIAKAKLKEQIVSLVDITALDDSTSFEAEIENILPTYSERYFSGYDSDSEESFYKQFMNNQEEHAKVLNQPDLAHLVMMASGETNAFATSWNMTIDEFIEKIIDNNYEKTNPIYLDNGKIKFDTAIPKNDFGFVSMLAANKFNEELKNKLDLWNKYDIGIKRMDSQWKAKVIGNGKNVFSEKLNALITFTDAQIVEIAAREMIYYSTFASLEYYQLVAGDPASFYKGPSNKLLSDSTSEEVNNFIHATNIDAVKRNAKNLAAGTLPSFDILRYDEKTDTFTPETQKTYHSAAISDNYRASINKDIMANERLAGMYGMDGKGRGKINVADALEYSSFEEHLHVMFAKGTQDLTMDMYKSMLPKARYQDRLKWNQKVPDQYKLTDEELKFVFGMMKPVQVSNVQFKSNGVGGANYATQVEVYIKSSSMPIIHQLFQGLEVAKLKQGMFYEGDVLRETPIDRLAYESAYKGGALRIANVWDAKGNITNIDALYPVELPREGFFIQQEIPYDELKNKILIMSQMDKLFTEGYAQHDKTDVLGRKAEVKKAMFREAKADFLKRFGAKLQEDGETYEFQDLNKVVELLKKEAFSRGFSKNVIDQLRIVDGKLDPMFFNTASQKYESVLASLVSGIILQKVHGHSYVQTSASGVITPDQIPDDFKRDIVTVPGHNMSMGLPFITKKDGKIEPAGVYVPFQFLSNKGKDGVQNKLNLNDYTITDETGTYLDMSKIDPSLLNLIGGRIPGQGPNSMLPIRILGFLPEYMGNTIVVPAEISVQMGSDFDVDKLYTYMWNYVVNSKTGQISKYDPNPKAIYKAIKILTDPFTPRINELKKRRTDELTRLVGEGVLEQVSAIKQLRQDTTDSIKEYEDAIQSYWGTEITADDQVEIDRNLYELKQLDQRLKDIDSDLKLIGEEKRKFANTTEGKAIQQELDQLYSELNEATKDFDSIAIVGQDIKSLQNQYFDLHWEVLTDENMFERIAESLDMDDLRLEFEKRTSKNEAAGLISPKFNRDTYLENRAGKQGCLGYGTKVLMYNGSFKEVQDIIIGDQLMGPDSKPRNVLETYKGIEQMYWVHQNRGMSYRVNESHILSLEKRNDWYKTKEIINIPLYEYLNTNKKFKSCTKGYKSTLINFNEQEISLDPYYLGLWLGDGCKKQASAICNIDSEIRDYLTEEYGIVRIEGLNNIIMFLKTDIINEQFKKCFGDRSTAHLKPNEKKYIPDNYIINSKEIRLALLAGLIDSDGYYCKKNKQYIIATVDPNLRDRICYLTRSLGFYTSYTAIKSKTKPYPNGKTYTSRICYNIRFIPEMNIPVKIERKKQIQKSDFKDRLVTGISLEKDIVDNYYGFKLDGDHLFLLEDLTVTHNTAIMANAIVINSITQNKGITLLQEGQDLSIKIKSKGKVLNLDILGNDARSQYDNEDRRIHKNLQNIQSESVDNAKNGRLGALNLNEDTFNAANALLMLSDSSKGGYQEGGTPGIGSVANDHVVALVEQDIIHEFIESKAASFNQFSKAKFSRYAEGKLKSSIIEKYYKLIHQKADEYIKIPSHMELIKNIVIPGVIELNSAKKLDLDSATPEQLDKYYRVQLNAFLGFLALDEVGQIVAGTQKAIDGSTKGIGKSFIESLMKERMFKDRIQDGNYESSYFGIKLNNVQSLEDSEYGVAMKEGVIFANNLFGKMFPYRNLFNKVTDYFKGQNKSLDEKDYRNIFNFYKTYIFANNDIYSSGDVVAERARLKEGDDNIFDRLKKYQAENTSGDYLLKGIVVEYDKVNKERRLKYSAGKSQRQDEYLNTVSLLKMLNSNDEELRRFGNDLITYSFLTNPIQSANNFMMYIPASVQQSNVVSAYLNKATMDMMDDNIKYADFMEQFIRHNPSFAPKKVMRRSYTSTIELQNYNTYLDKILQLQSELKKPGLSDEEKTSIGNEIARNSAMKNAWFSSTSNPIYTELDEDREPNKFNYITFADPQNEVNGEFDTTMLFKTNKDPKTGQYVLSAIPLLGTYESRNMNSSTGFVDTSSVNSYELGNEEMANRLIPESETDLTDALENIKTYGNSNQTEIADILRQIVSPTAKISVDTEAKNPGIYIASEDKIVINPNLDNKFNSKSNREDIISGIIHESWHSAFNPIVERYMEDPNSVTEAQRISIKRLDILRKDALKAARKNNKKELTEFLGNYMNLLKQDEVKNANKILSLQDTINFVLESPNNKSINTTTSGITPQMKAKYYGLVNVQEFVTMAWSDNNFQTVLNEIKASKPEVKSFLERIVEAFEGLFRTILESFGITVNPNNVLAHTLAESYNVVSDNKEVELNKTSTIWASKIQDKVIYSGDATGSDREFKKVGKQFGIRTVDYTPQTYDKLTPVQAEEVEQAYVRAVNYLGRQVISLDNEDKGKRYSAKLVRRDYLQAKAGDSVYAIIEGFETVFDKTKQGMKVIGQKTFKVIPKGGTAYAMIMADDMGKPVYAFDQSRQEWYKYTKGTITKIDIPVLSERFAGVGTKNINEAGQQAIVDLFENTYPELVNNKEPENNNSEPTIKDNPIIIDAKFPKDQIKANYADGIIGYGSHSTGKYASKFGGTRESFTSNEVIMISVNGNNRSNQKENVELTKRAIDKALNQGVKAFIADNETVANSSHNSGGEGEIRKYLLDKGLQYQEFNNVGLYTITSKSSTDKTSESIKTQASDIFNELEIKKC